jgi:hypothetical protein
MQTCSSFSFALEANRERFSVATEPDEQSDLDLLASEFSDGETCAGTGLQSGSPQLLENDEQLVDDFWSDSFLERFDRANSDESGFRSQQALKNDEQPEVDFSTDSARRYFEEAKRDELEAMLPPPAKHETAAKEFTKRSNPFSGYDNFVSGTVRGAFAVSASLGPVASLIGAPSVVSDAITAGFELHNAKGESEKLALEKISSCEGNAEFAKNYGEIVSIRNRIAAGTIAAAEAQDRLSTLKAKNRELARQALTYDKAVGNESSAKLMLAEKSFRAVRDFIFGPSGTGVAAAKLADFIQTGTIAKITDFASKAGTALGTGVAIGGAVVGACTGALHLLQSIPEMRRWSKRVDEQSGLCASLAGIRKDNIGEIIGSARAKDKIDADVVKETEDVLAHVAERCHTENKKALGVAKAEFAKSIIRCVFGLGSIVLGIVGFFFPPVALAALLFGAVYAIYVGVHILVLRKLAAKQAEALAAEEKQSSENSGSATPLDLKDNSAWLVSKVCDYLQGRAREGKGKFQSGAVKRLLLEMGMDKTLVKAVQAKAEAIDDIPDAGDKAKAVKELRQDLRYYLFSGGAGRKAPAPAP